MPEAIVALGESKRIVGRLRFETDGRRQHSQFEYAPEWLADPDRFALSPALPLRTGGFFSSGRDDKTSALSGCFADAAPDAWGRALMRKALGGGLTEFDYLVLADDRTRQGALRFLGEDLEPLSALNPPIPRLVELEELRALAHRFERDPEGAEAEARRLAGAGGSLGGARPKANITEADGHLWIAKFTSVQDTKPIERAEIATLRLAKRCGLRVPEARLELRASDSPIALIRRFDRRGPTRIPYISARTALDWSREEGAFYTDIGDVIRQISAKPIDDLHELWRRIVFTVLVSNKDDHLQNHGFLYAGGDRWRLSPAFDINPSPSRQRVLETGIVEGGAFDASYDIALGACEFFDLTRDEAKQQAREMAELIAADWKQALLDEGMLANEARSYEDAFVHDEAKRALQA
ncbi:type II toxin-antitoxin system HipA family toxin [Hyphococcus luteus]|uniref:Type II toxin-antitoxin system HipA family toxin n=1 Tax=Hyphococcus luteus TaxID=2058213 RepID=A0A2S7K753_9PROT|nr:type II toxin-antitoxin system HipA family toxin [Marinicaulis flavus]PQA88327.1 type II toxin-antitoxin system HipA family toxin [Marinicaulis flavus]